MTATFDIEYLINDDELARAADAALRADAAVGGVVASGIRPVNKAFKSFVGGRTAGVGELAMVTLLQAVAHDRPVLFLPLTALGRFQHQTLISVADLSVADLPGRTVGVRAWSQTTGVWVRGVLAHQFGIDLQSVRWRTYEGGHVAENDEPDWVERAPAGSKLADDLLTGAVDFAVMGNDRPDDPRVRSVIDDPAKTARAWAESVGHAPVNHVFAVSTQTARELGGAVCAAYDAIAERLRARRGDASGVPLEPYGFLEMRPSVTAAAQYAWEQGLLPRPVTWDELVERTCAELGVAPARLGG